MREPGLPKLSGLSEFVADRETDFEQRPFHVGVEDAANRLLDQLGRLAAQARLVGRACGSFRPDGPKGVALVLEPRALVMDEPMAGMGMDGTEQMIRLLDELRTQTPILLVEHDMDAVFTLADRISVLVSGRILATGTAEEIRADEQVQNAYLGRDTAS